MRLNDLQLALLSLAAAVLIALYVAGKWQERRLLRRLSEGLRSGVGDALLKTARTEPSLGERAGGSAPVAQRIEPRLDIELEPTQPDAAAGRATAAPAAAEAQRPALAVQRSDWVEDPLLDCVLELRCARAVDGVSVIDAAMPLAAPGWPLAVFFVVWDPRSRQWVLPDRFGYYTDALAAIQMASRRRVLSEIDASRFVAAVQQVAAALDADFDPPDVARLVASAQALDRLCARFDVRIGLTLECADAPKGAWPAARIAAAAQQAGLSAVDAQRWVRLDAEGRPLFSLASASLLADRLALELDVPLAPAQGAPFRAMIAAADQLGAALGARVVDDKGRPIDASSVAVIEAQLAQLHEEMLADGIEPGGARARRLYV
jgi:hypothetical protein